MIEHFQDQDWNGVPHETFVIVWLYMLVSHFIRTLTFSGPLLIVLLMFKVSVGSVNTITGTQPLCTLLQTQHTYKHTRLPGYIGAVLLSSFHNYTIMYVCMSLNYACM